MPTSEDAVDTVATEKIGMDKTPSPTDPHAKLLGIHQPEDENEVKTDSADSEFYENPFLKPPKRIRLRPF